MSWARMPEMATSVAFARIGARPLATRRAFMLSNSCWAEASIEALGWGAGAGGAGWVGWDVGASCVGCGAGADSVRCGAGAGWVGTTGWLAEAGWAGGASVIVSLGRAGCCVT